MNPFKALIKNPLNTAYDGEDPDETILYIIRRSVITNVPWILFALILLMLPSYAVPFIQSFKNANGAGFVTQSFLLIGLVFWYLFIFGYVFYNYCNWYYNVPIITSKKIVDVDFEGLLLKNISETTLNNVEDVTSRVQGTISLIFNIGDVLIQTAGEKREFEFTGTYNPAGIRDILADLVASLPRGNNT